jgi:5-methylcytosine-specific restriction endonuclease McrA
MPDCKSCGEPFSDFTELADHILKNQAHHPEYSVKWARTYTMRKVIRVPKPIERQPITEQMKNNRGACVRDDISGRMKIATTFCANCKQTFRQPIPIELDNPMAWRVRDMIVVTCENCSRKNRRF